ncbi:MAG TPA: nuclear transport factor 2 family protein [Mycobacteriales bacterium]|jgi:hypothetical protein|nr:nuclear transport factor 2 family protein [Mycobacteriales bacterium]
MTQNADSTWQADDIARAYWTVMGARDWPALTALLADDVLYELPQSRERVRGAEALVRFSAEYPGDWEISLERVVGQGWAAATWIDFRLDGAAQPGLTFFELDDDGRIVRVTDFWPDPYEPPPGREHLVERY